MDGEENRSHGRIPWRGSVHLVAPAGDRIAATIQDMSEVGLGLWIERAVEAGMPVGIDGTGFHGAGVVRYCYRREGGFRVGVELGSPS